MNGDYKNQATTRSHDPATPAHLGRGPDAGDARAQEIAVIGHELRNSLAVISRAARLLRAPAVLERVDAARSLIERQLGQMRRHIDDLVQPVRNGAARHGLQLTRLDLRVIARFAADGVASQMARRGHRFAVTLPPEPCWIQGDGARLEQALSNLLKMR